MASKKKWALRPGERKPEDAYEKLQEDNQDKKYEALLEEHRKKHDDLLIFNDEQQVVFFIQQSKGAEAINEAEVAVYDGEKYNFLPQEEAAKLTRAYLHYVDMLVTVGNFNFGEDEEA